MTLCKVCGMKIIEPVGPIGGVLIAGEFPGEEEMRRGIPFVGTSGNILRSELGKAGLSIDTCRVTNLWLHRMSPSMYEEEGHFDWHLSRLLEEIGMAKHILLLGSELAQVFLKRGVTDVCGLEYGSPYFQDGTVATFGTNPASIIHSTAGEFRLACQKFVKRIHDKGD